MIFYFSGTGNSKHVAYSLANNEKVINMAEAMNHLDFHYTLKEGEKLGFVFPVYCYTINDLIVDFIYHLNIENASYTYSIVTCGGNTGHLDGYLKKLLKERAITLDYFAQLEMPDDTVIYYNIEDDEHNRKNSSKRIRS